MTKSIVLSGNVIPFLSRRAIKDIVNNTNSTRESSAHALSFCIDIDLALLEHLQRRC
ncbi:hypothetical protein BD408DRAFT_417983 [Parasitella parasitica]|nr:hypothetical protein BD408DRAFT_417983 [Parasitella parasitica]